MCTNANLLVFVLDVAVGIVVVVVVVVVILLLKLIFFYDCFYFSEMKYIEKRNVSCRIQV